MTLSSTLNRVSYDGNGSSTAFPVSFPFHAQTDLVVLEVVIATGVQTTKVLNSDYTVSGTTDALGHYSNGGTVNATVAPASTVRWVIYRDPVRTQLLDLQDASRFPAENIEAQLDYVTMLVQRVSDLINRTTRQPDGDASNIGTLPSSVDRASKFLAFDGSGDPIAAVGTSADLTPVSSFINTLLDDVNAATARTTLGAVGLTGDETIAGEKTFSSAIPSPTLTTPTMTSPTVSIGPLTMTSGQIAFPSTQNPSAGANTLDDYEEGSWTPSLGGNTTYSSQVGAYTKIGNVVYISCQVVVTTIGTGSTTVISGLPFAAATSHCVTAISQATNMANTFVFITGNVTGSTIQLRNLAAAGAGFNTTAVFGNSTGITLSGFYFV